METVQEAGNIMGETNLLGTVLNDRYRIEEKLGEGGMSAVYLATHLTLDRPVAIKVIRDSLVKDDVVRARFEREARAAARLTHPNIVHVHDFGSFEDGVYISMEYIEGLSLRELLLQRGRLDLESALDIIQQSCAAVAAAHAVGILHRDIKPENLMIYHDETGKRRVKVVDFGLAKLISTDESQQLTQKTEMVGTPKYMAPERTTGDEVDERADVYALAIVMFEMLTGRAPFEGTFKEVVGKHLFEEPPSLESFGAEVPKAVESVIHQGMSKEVEDRIPSALAFARAMIEACEVSSSEFNGSIPSDDLLPVQARTGFETVHATSKPQVDTPGGTTRYADDLPEIDTRVRSHTPTLYMPDPNVVSHDSGSVERSSPGYLQQSSGSLPAIWGPALGTIAVVVILGLTALVGVGSFLLWSKASAHEEARQSQQERAPEQPKPVGQITLPDDPNLRIILEMDASKIRPGARLQISGDSLPRAEFFKLQRAPNSGIWSVGESSHSAPSGLTLDEILRPGATLSLIVQNPDGSSFLPRITTE